MDDPVSHIRLYLINEDLRKHRQILFDIFFAAVASPRFQDTDYEDMGDVVFHFQKTVEVLEGAYRMIELLTKGRMQVQITKHGEGD